jgi:CheY-like chemotaxis protein
MKKNILLVDDDKIFNFLSEKTIASLGFANEIHFASNGQHALELLELCRSGEIQKPDIIFLDLNMPIMNGYEFYFLRLS